MKQALHAVGRKDEKYFPVADVTGNAVLSEVSGEAFAIYDFYEITGNRRNQMPFGSIQLCKSFVLNTRSSKS